MESIEWSAMAEAPRDGRGIVAKTPGGDVFFFIRWDGDRWVCGTAPVDPKGLVWRLPSGKPLG